jgi:hypothetical protein
MDNALKSALMVMTFEFSRYTDRIRKDACANDRFDKDLSDFNGRLGEICT